MKFHAAPVIHAVGGGRPQLRMLFIVVTAALFMQSLDVTIVATALHALQTNLQASVNWAAWTITIYSFGLVLMLPLSARLCGKLGCRPVFLVSIAGFSVASLCCGLANDIVVLIVMRALQAVCGAGLNPSATGIVVNHFGKSRDRAVGLFGSAFQVGAMTGPVLGGLFVSYLSWRWIFFVNVPTGIVLITLGAKVIPRDAPPLAGTGARLDVAGMGLLGVAILSGMTGVTLLGEHGPLSWAAVTLSVTMAVTALWLFLRRTHRVRDPFIPAHLIHGRGFAAVNVVNVLYGGATVGVISLVPLYASNRYHLTALASGTLLTANAITAAVLSALGAVALRRTGYRMPLYLSAVLGAVGMFALALGPRGGVSAYTWLAIAAAVVGVGKGWSDPAARNAGLQLVPEQSASIAALRTVGRQVGTVAAVSIMTAAIAGTASPGSTQAYWLAGFGVLLLCAAPVIARVPEHRGSW